MANDLDNRLEAYLEKRWAQLNDYAKSLLCSSAFEKEFTKTMWTFQFYRKETEDAQKAGELLEALAEEILEEHPDIADKVRNIIQQYI